MRPAPLVLVLKGGAAVSTAGWLAYGAARNEIKGGCGNGQKASGKADVCSAAMWTAYQTPEELAVHESAHGNEMSNSAQENWNRNSSMTVIAARRNPNRAPTHPGALLESTVLPALKRPKTEIARLLGISRQSLYDILSGKHPVTPETAVRLGKLCGNGAALWINMQAAHDLWRAEHAVDVSKIPTLEPA